MSLPTVKGRNIADELERRKGHTRAVVELFLAHRGEWLGPHEIAKAGGFSAWRTRISDARDIVKLDGYEILWNEKNGSDTAYMLRPRSLGRDAGTPVPAPWNQDRPYAEEFKLT